MAVLYVTEFAAVGLQNGTSVQAVVGMAVVANNNVAIGAASAASSAFNARTTVIRLHSDRICSFVIGAIGATPTATASNARMAADQTEYFVVSPGQKVAVIENS